MKVLGQLIEKRYPNYRAARKLSDPIATLTPIISRALKVTYPPGVSSLER